MVSRSGSSGGKSAQIPRAIGVCRRFIRFDGLGRLEFPAVAVSLELAEVAVRKSALVLVDYDNLYPEPPADPSSLLRHDILSIADSLARVVPDVEVIQLRFYGGWVMNGLLSRQASELSSALSVADPFPSRHPARSGVLHGSVELALTLLAVPNIDLGDTVRPRRGLSHVRLSGAPVPAGCVKHPTSCPATILRRFTRRWSSRCSATGCPVTNRDGFIRLEQKMVDTMLTCDALHACDRLGLSALAIMSTDVDLMPCLLSVAQSGRTSIQVGPASGWGEPQREALRQIGAHLMEMSS